MKIPLKLPISLIFAFLFLFLSVVTLPRLVHADFVRIRGSVVNVRQGPGTTHPVLFQAEQGEEFPLIKTEGLWCLIQLEGGDQAWVFARLIDVIPGEITERDVDTPEPQPMKPATSLGHKVFRAFLYLALLLFILFLFGKRRRIAEKVEFKLREASGYDREKPFRYDDHQPRDDSWEL